MKQHDVVRVSVIPNDPMGLSGGKKAPIKTTTMIVFHDEEPRQKIESFLKERFNWSKGLHYQDFVYEVTETVGEIKNTSNNQQSNTTEMAKKSEQQEPIIEEANVIEETANVASEQEEVQTAEVVSDESEDTKFEATLPQIPKQFVVSGRVHSLAVVKDLEAKADKLLAKADDKSFENKELWNQIDELRKEAKDQRTKLESKRKELVKPINDALSNLKATTDEIGNAAKVVEDKLATAIKKRDEWEEEQARIERERIIKRNEERKEKLRKLGGSYDINTSIFTFEHNKTATVSIDNINDWSDEEFEEELSFINDSYQKHLAKIEEEKAEAARAKLEAEESKKALDMATQQLVEMREMILVSGGYSKDESGYHKNGYTIKPDEVKSLSNQDFIQLTATHNTPKEVPVEYKKEESPLTPVNAPADVEIPKAIELSDDDLPADAIPTPDPLADVISNKVEAHNAHQESVDGIKKVVLEFSNKNPYIDVQLRASILRLTHSDFEDASLQNMNAEQDVIAKSVKDDLIFMVIGAKKK